MALNVVTLLVSSSSSAQYSRLSVELVTTNFDGLDFAGGGGASCRMFFLGAGGASFVSDDDDGGVKGEVNCISTVWTCCDTRLSFGCKWAELLEEEVEACGGGGGAVSGVEFTDEASRMSVSEVAFDWTEWNVETVGVVKSYTVEREREREREKNHNYFCGLTSYKSEL